ncbi:hypothetical protein ACFE04_025093 [Oxalis oulophora]
MGDYTRYAHSPAHFAVASRDHAALTRLISTLPTLSKAGDINTEAQSLQAELQADAVSSVIDRRDVPGRETPLHLAVRLRDPLSAEILMTAGADWSLQNENGWSALQEAVCTREESIAMIIARHYQPLAWAKWCRRLPRIVASANRIRDFYMEITFHFESSVIPFIGRIAPSDTYRIWKRGSNLRADMTLAGFDGFRIQRSDQTFLFLGEGYNSENGKLSLPRGSLVVLAHKEKEVTNALEGAGTQPTESEVAHEVKLMSQTNMYRPGIDVTQAELIPHLNWRRQERSEMVGNWKAKVYDMFHVMVSVKSRRVPGAMTDEELFAVDDEDRIPNGGDHDEYDDVLTAEERQQLDSALRMTNGDGVCDEEEPGFVDCQENASVSSHDSSESNGSVKEKKGWFGWNKKGSKHPAEGGNHKSADNHKLLSDSSREDGVDAKKGKEKSGKKKKKKGPTSENKTESEYKKGLRPVLWLTPDFPLKTDELLPLLDILANKVKAIRRLRELLTTKLPPGTFPVKRDNYLRLRNSFERIRDKWNGILPLFIAIPIVPTIRVLITFTKFEELAPVEEFCTPPSSPQHFHDAKSKDPEGSSSWMSWMRGSRNGQSSDSDRYKEDVDPFVIPEDYTWIDASEKKRRMKAKRAKNRRHRKPATAKNGDMGSTASAADIEN